MGSKSPSHSIDISVKSPRQKSIEGGVVDHRHMVHHGENASFLFSSFLQCIIKLFDMMKVGLVKKVDKRFRQEDHTQARGM